MTEKKSRRSPDIMQTKEEIRFDKQVQNIHTEDNHAFPIKGAAAR
jgi:hypothetical protein